MVVASAVGLAKVGAIAAPTAAAEPPVVAASAIAAALLLEVAVRVAFPPPAAALEPVPRSAFALIVPMTRASEPATPTPAPAPLVACAERSELDGASAMSVRPLLEELPLMLASSAAFASVIAIAAPIAADPPV